MERNLFRTLTAALCLLVGVATCALMFHSWFYIHRGSSNASPAYAISLFAWFSLCIVHAMERKRAAGEELISSSPGMLPMPWLLFFILMSVAVYFRAITSIGFLSDDFCYVYDMIGSKSPGAVIRRIWLPDRSHYFRPLVNFSFYIDGLYSGVSPVAFHIHNIVAHGIMAFTVARIAFLFLGRAGTAGALAAGLLYLVFPGHHEVVTWIACRYDLYFALFSSLMLYVFLRPRFRRRDVGLTLVLFICAILSKESALAYPALLTCVLLVRPGFWQEGTVRKRLFAVILTVVAVCLYFLYRYMILGTFTLFSGGRSSGVRETLLHLPSYIVGSNPLDFFLMQMSHVQLPAAISIPIGAILIALVTLAALRPGRVAAHPKALILSGGWALAAFLPALGPGLKASFESSRWLYAPSAGLAILLTALAVRLPNENDSSARSTVRNAGLPLIALTFAYLLLNSFRMDAWCQAERNKEAFRKELRSLQPVLPQAKRELCVRGSMNLDNVFGALSLRNTWNLLEQNASGKYWLLKPKLTAFSWEPLNMPILAWDSTTETLHLTKVSKVGKRVLVEYLDAAKIEEPESCRDALPVTASRLKEFGIVPLFQRSDVHIERAAGDFPCLHVVDLTTDGARIGFSGVAVDSYTAYTFRMKIRNPEPTFEWAGICVYGSELSSLATRFVNLGNGWSDAQISFDSGDNDTVCLGVIGVSTRLHSFQIAEVTLQRGLYGEKQSITDLDLLAGLK